VARSFLEGKSIQPAGLTVESRSREYPVVRSTFNFWDSFAGVAREHIDEEMHFIGKPEFPGGVGRVCRRPEEG
jgi:hypothetical protein